MAEIITKDRKEYNIWDKINGVWNRLNFLTNAKSVDADDGKTLETKVGALNGITSDLSCEDESIAISAKAVNDSLSSLGGFKPVIDNTGKITGYTTTKGGADTVFPFRNQQFVYKYKEIATYNNNTVVSFDFSDYVGFNALSESDFLTCPSGNCYYWTDSTHCGGAVYTKAYDNSTGILSIKIRNIDGAKSTTDIIAIIVK